jgi:hypothetical protein
MFRNQLKTSFSYSNIARETGLEIGENPQKGVIFLHFETAFVPAHHIWGPRELSCGRNKAESCLKKPAAEKCACPKGAYTKKNKAPHGGYRNEGE